MNLQEFLFVLAAAMLFVVVAMSSVIAPKTGKATDRLLPRMACEIIFIAIMVYWANLEFPGNIQALAASGMLVALIADIERLCMRLVEYRRQRFNRDT